MSYQITLVGGGGSMSVVGVGVATVSLTAGIAGPQGIQGDPGADGAAGPNLVSSTTSTDLTGYLKGNGSTVTSSATVPIADVTGTVPSAQLPIASAGALGAVRVGNNLSIDGSGILSGVAAVSSAALDAAFGTTRGSILRRGASGWELLTPGTSGQYLQTAGTGADPIWSTVNGMAIGGTVTSGTAGRVLYVGAGPVLADSQNVQISGRELQILSDDGTSTIMKLGTTGTGAFQPYIDPGLYRQLTIGNANSDLLLIGNVRVQTLYTTNGLEFLQFSQSFRMRNWVDNLPRTLACIWTSPSQLTGNVNNYNPDYGRNFRLSSSTSVDITGLSLSSQIDGMEVWFHNVGSNTITFKHQDTNSSASNRIICTTGADIALAANEAAGAIYDSTSSRWRLWKL